jgi:hypothetical protein
VTAQPTRPFGPLFMAMSAARDRFRFPGCRAIVSFPKSGRTQLRVMLDALGLEVPFSHAGSSDERGRTADALASGPAYWRRCRILFMMRDPRDTAVSAYYHACYRSRRFDGDLHAFLREPRLGLEKIILFHLLWLAARHSFPRFAVLQYEDLQSRPEEELARAAAFLTARRFAPEALRHAAEAGSFANMRRLEESGEGTRRFGAALAPGDPADPQSFKTRRGVAGGWTDALSPADKDFAAQLFARHGYESRLAAAGISPPFPLA